MLKVNGIKVLALVVISSESPQEGWLRPAKDWRNHFNWFVLRYLCSVYTCQRLALSTGVWHSYSYWPVYYTVRKMNLILRPIERRPQMQFSMARRFKLQLLRRYSVKFYKMRNITLGPPWLDKLKNTGGRRTSILRICSLWLYHCATITCDLSRIFKKI